MIGYISSIVQSIEVGDHDDYFLRLYGDTRIDSEKQRYLGLLNQLLASQEDSRGMLVSGPGRTELAGNHTDHNLGRVMAAAVNLDCVAAVSPHALPVVELTSTGFERQIRVDLNELEPSAGEYGSPESLIRGMAAQIFVKSRRPQGFRGYLHATCMPGTGISSSAAFAVMVGGIFSFMFCANEISAERLATMAGNAENSFFGKPCGLMDQMSSAVGNVLAIDFKNPERPHIETLDIHKVPGYRMVVVDTGGSHVELTKEYAAIPEEMMRAAEFFGQKTARGIGEEQIIGQLAALRSHAGDRAALRLLHFTRENERVKLMSSALSAGDYTGYLDLVRQSGESSCMLLQNCASAVDSSEQGILLGLELTRQFCPGAVARVHGGGFAGTIQAYIPVNELGEYVEKMERVFGENSVIQVAIGRPGLCGLTEAGIVLPPREVI